MSDKTEKKIVNFTDVHDKLVQKNNHMITASEFNAWVKENLIIEKYMPISKKFAIISILRNKLQTTCLTFDNGKGSFEEDYVNMEYEERLIFDILFSYTNIVTLDKYKTTDNYDLIMTSGFYNYLIKICGKDYDLFVSECNKVINIGNTFFMKQFIEVLSKIPNVDDTKEIKNIIDSIDKDKIKILENVEAYNNPQLHTIVDSINKSK